MITSGVPPSKSSWSKLRVSQSAGAWLTHLAPNGCQPLGQAFPGSLLAQLSETRFDRLSNGFGDGLATECC